MAKSKTPAPDMAELGTTGLLRQSGYIYEEQLRELRGDRWIKTVRNMVDNDSTVGAILYAIEMLARQASWEVVEFDDSSEAKQDAEFFKGAMFDDMSHTWNDTLSEMLSFLPFGWAYLEEVYKRRGGDTNDPTTRSRFTDNKIGWRKWSIRSQESLVKWEFDESGGIAGMVQRPAPKYVETFIPIQKALLFRTSSRKGNPEGRSILRNAYKDWYYKTNVGRIEAIGIERNIAGIPIAELPPEYFGSDANPSQKAMLSAVKEIVTNVRNDEQAGIVFPRAFDEHGNSLFSFSLLGGNTGQKLFDLDKTFQRYNTGMAVSILADFMFLGHEGTGSFALSNNKTALFSTALSAFLDAICDVVNRYAIPRLARFNGMQTEKLPSLRHGDVESVDLKELGEYINKISGAGFDVAGVPGLLSGLLERAKLPVPEEDEGMDTEARPPENDAAKDENV